jgi:hypothetical protein
VDVVVAKEELAIPPQIKLEQAKGLACICCAPLSADAAMR